MAFTSKPTAVPEWATGDVVDGVTGQNNVVEPPALKKLNGWAWQEKPARNWWNWLQRFNYLWINYFNQFFSVTHQFKIDEIIENTTDNGVNIETINFEDGDLTLLTGKTLKGTGEGAGIEEENGAIIRTKIIDIGDWNMDSTITVNVAHGLDTSKIRNIIVGIRGDAGSSYADGWIPLDYSTTIADPAGNFRLNVTDPSDVNMSRQNGGFFDTVDFDATSFNRGWIVIQYVD